MQLGHAMAKSGHAILFPYSVAEPGSDPQASDQEVLKSFSQSTDLCILPRKDKRV